MMRSVLLVALVLLTACSKDAFIRPGADVTKRIQEALIAAKPGDVIALAEGKFEIDRPLSLSVAKVRLKGAGLDKTILNFARQTKGSAGLLVTAGDFVIEEATPSKSMARKTSPSAASKPNGPADLRKPMVPMASIRCSVRTC